MRVIYFFIALLFFNSIQAKTSFWTSANAGDWAVASNWSEGVPISGDSAIIIFSGSIVSIQNTAQAEYIFIGANTKLNVTGNLSLENSSGDAIRAEGMISILSGSISIVNPQGEGLLVMDSLYNNGTIYIQDVKNWPFSGLRVDGGRLENAASIIINNCRIGFINSQGYVWNKSTGSINAIACGVLFRQSDIFSINEGTLATTAGYISVIEGGRLDNLPEANMIVSGGSIIVNKNSILNSYGMTSIQSDTGIYVSMGGNLNLMDGSLTSLSKGSEDRLFVNDKGKINIEEGAIVTLQ